MKLVADEGVEHGIVDRLRAEGHDVVYIAELDPGISDEAVLEQANQSRAPLLTNDKDFGELVFRQGKAQAGVILLRLAGVSEERKAGVVSAVIAAHGAEFHGTFSVVSPGQVRIRSAS